MENQFSISVKTALDVLLPVAVFAASERSLADVYKHVLIKHDGTKCFAIAGNGSQSLIRSLSLPMLAVEPFQVCLDGVKLRAILSGLKDAAEQDMVVSWTEANATIKIGRSKLTLAVINPSGYPSPDRLGNDASTLILPLPVILEALRSVFHACADKDARHFLNGCFLSFDVDKLIVAGTDGHRLCRIVKQVGTGNTGQGILPRKFVEHFHFNAGKVAGDVRLRLTSNMVEATWDGGQLRSNLIDGKYPDISPFFDKGNIKLFQCSKDSMMQSISRLRATVFEKLPSVAIEASSSELRLVTLDEHKAESGIDYVGATICSSLEKPISININYLSECINHIDDDELVFCLSEHGGVIIKAADSSEQQEIINPLRR